MKAITLWQPWASLLACGAKKYETRSWATSYRGPIAIHAAAKRPTTIWGAIEHMIDKVRAALRVIDPDDLPRGAIIATAELVGCHEIRLDPFTRTPFVVVNGRMTNITGNEILFGDWTPGRYAWEFANMTMLPEPIPAKGKQRIWEWEANADG